MLTRILGLLALALTVAGVHADIGNGQTPGLPASGLTVTGRDGTLYSGAPVIIQVAEAADPPVQIALAATAANGATWTALFGASLDMLARGSLTIDVERRPLRAGAGVVTHGPIRRGTPPPAGTLRLRLGPSAAVEGSAALDPAPASVTFTGRYGLSCWVQPQTLGRPGNGEGARGAIERVEDEDFQSEFCRRVAHLLR